MESKQAVLILDKKRGETPLECLNRFKKDNPEYENEKMTYAGRLDPLASGLLLVLVGEECKNKEKYLEQDKEYELDVLFGFATDSYDVLGKVICHSREGGNPGMKVLDPVLQLDDTIKEILSAFIGRFSQKYPAFSSKTIGGEPLFALAKSGGISEDEIPTKDVEIKNIELLNEKEISKSDLGKFIKDSVALVSGDFRQEEILELWSETLNNTKQEQFKIISIKVSCTSGTYMRSLANEIGIKIGIPALALNIKRIKVGDYVSLDKS
jgi:tRNA pseudouridine55 synthase